MEGEAGVIAIEVTVATACTVTITALDTVPTVAVIVADPPATPVATPGVPVDPDPTVATAVAEEVHVAEAVKS
jgi:hypothetical protein